MQLKIKVIGQQDRCMAQKTLRLAKNGSFFGSDATC